MPSVSQLLRNLRVETRILESHKARLTHITGLGLEDFSRLTPRDVRAFERAVRAFWRSYAKAIREAADLEGRPGIQSEDIEALRYFHRLFRYRKEGRRVPPMPSAFCLDLSCFHTKEFRIMVGARLYWLQCRAQKGEEKYPKEGRYHPLQLDHGFLLRNLEKNTKWLVDWTIAPTYEVAVLISHVENLMGLRKEWDSKLTDIADFVAANELSTIPRVRDFTTPATEQAIQSAGEGSKTCDICVYAYSHAYSDEAMTEPAVKTRCGHILGSHCLQNWVDSGHSTCPACRQAMYGMDLVLPEMVRPNYSAVIQLLQQVQDLDGRIDAYLLQGNKEAHDDDFTPLVRNLDRIGFVCHHMFEEMFTSIQVAASMKDAPASAIAEAWDGFVDRDGDVLMGGNEDGYGDFIGDMLRRA